MLALGPFFHEQTDFEAHKPFRDQMATFEYELASHLKQRGHDVLGVHYQGAEVSATLLAQVKAHVDEFLCNTAAN